MSRDGKAYNPIHFNQQVTTHLSPDGYPCFGGGVAAHLYVAYAWVPGWFPGAEVDHIDYDRTNYAADNLRWVSHNENIRHSYEDEDHYTGRHNGVKNPRATFTEEEVQHIRDLYDSGYTTVEIIKAFYPDYNAQERKRVWNRFNNIKTGATWSS